jgi:hypothetical protein
MVSWFLLATKWRSDGTPVPDHRLVDALLNGDPLAIAYVGVIVFAIIGPVVYKFLYKP